MHKIVTVMFYWLVCIAVLMVATGCGEEEGDIKAALTPVDLLPDDNDISGWLALGAYDEANDSDVLYDIINGGAEIYIDEGFVSAVFQVYRGDIGIVRLSIYDQGSEVNALATYDRVSAGIDMPWDEAGTEARIVSALAAYTVEFWQLNFFVRVVIEEGTDEALNVAKLFASHISEQIW